MQSVGGDLVEITRAPAAIVPGRRTRPELLGQQLREQIVGGDVHQSSSTDSGGELTTASRRAWGGVRGVVAAGPHMAARSVVRSWRAANVTGRPAEGGAVSKVSAELTAEIGNVRRELSRGAAARESNSDSSAITAGDAADSASRSCAGAGAVGP